MHIKPLHHAVLYHHQAREEQQHLLVKEVFAAF